VDLMAEVFWGKAPRPKPITATIHSVRSAAHCKSRRIDPLEKRGEERRRTEIRSKSSRRRQKPVREKINRKVEEYWTRKYVSDG